MSSERESSAHDTLRGTKAAQRVSQFRFSRDLFCRNYDELRTFLDYFCAPQVAFSYSHTQERWLWHAGMEEITRLLHNFVAGALSLVEHTRVLYRHLYEPHAALAGYQSEIDKRFTNDPLSQFVIKLRQMAQHYRLPSLSNRTTMKNIQSGRVGEVQISLELKVEDLREFSGWTAPAKAYLEQAGSVIDLGDLITQYFSHVMTFYEWFAQEQRKVHGIGPDLHRQLVTHGVYLSPRAEVAEFTHRIEALTTKDAHTITFAEIEHAFDPVLSIVDSRLLMLCRYDGQVWIDAALAAAKRHFSIPAALESRVRALLVPGR